ncbi:MAG: methyltransferase domain-containing protein [Desulfobulbaceae bacterium]|nr:methyltransferase domain-containing protein [Desulfobulbaceae bacterium]
MDEKLIKAQTVEYYDSLATDINRKDQKATHLCTSIVDEQSAPSLPAAAARLYCGCDSPFNYATLNNTLRVVDLGCGAGHDVFLAANALKEHATIVGIDISPAMVEIAQQNLDGFPLKNHQIFFRLADIELYPMPRNFADLVLSNNTIHLCPNPSAVYRNIFRALRPDGTVIYSDIVKTKESKLATIPPLLKEKDHITTLQSLSFVEVEIVNRQYFTHEQAKSHCKPILRGLNNQTPSAVSLEDEIYAITLRAKRPPFSC